MSSRYFPSVHLMPALALLAGLAGVVPLAPVRAAEPAKTAAPAAETKTETATRAEAETETIPAAPEYRYEVKINGAPTEEIGDLLEESSRLRQLEGKPPPSLASLRRRADVDVEGFMKVLRSEGYYGGEVAYKLEARDDLHVITFEITPGPLFRLTKFDINFKGAGELPEKPALSDIGIERGMPARSEPVVTAASDVIADLAHHGYPDAAIEKQDVVVDFATDAMEVTLNVNTGARLYFGDLHIEGLKQVEEEYIRRLARWQPGILYDTRVIDDLRRRYLRSGLFESVHLKPRGEIIDGKTVPITLAFTERDHRSVGLGASYSTSEGFGTQYFWEHRNFFGNGEKLRTDLTIAQIKRELSVKFVKPNFISLDQNLNANFDIRQEETDAYDEDAVAAFVGLDRRWRKRWVIGAGGSLEYSRIDEDGVTNNYALAGLPLTARYDHTDDLLDPTKGRRFSSTLVPYMGLNANTPDFLRLEMDGSVYYPVVGEGRVVLAARGKLGMMVGDDASDIPASKRFYSGGGGSIRGYKFQSVGPLDADNDPLGGRSLLEVGFEARTKITDSIGLVPFIEGGNVYDSMAPDFSGDFLWGAGLGFRYYTAIGPIRFDVALPLNRRKNVDDAYQFYISIGQAF
ncbi:autotransporter assembly complex protein TamA [Sneathiella sp.]|uniref:autotransporter assembly complex protein TamA n=1 Tax=Sneathiella sp. TaxID=1964365 RepID=UPI0025D720F5|nr:autotransporter assembly complex family protein [Sneathiella sp.]